MPWFDMVSFLLPAIISMVVKPGWSNGVKYLVAFGFSFLAALGQVLFEADCQPCLENFPKILGKTFVLVMGSYAAFWRPTGLAQKIEEKVNP
jgi:hypothetical protein